MWILHRQKRSAQSEVLASIVSIAADYSPSWRRRLSPSLALSFGASDQPIESSSKKLLPCWLFFYYLTFISFPEKRAMCGLRESTRRLKSFPKCHVFPPSCSWGIGTYEQISTCCFVSDLLTARGARLRLGGLLLLWEISWLMGFVQEIAGIKSQALLSYWVVESLPSPPLPRPPLLHRHLDSLLVPQGLPL